MFSPKPSLLEALDAHSAPAGEDGRARHTACNQLHELTMEPLLLSFLLVVPSIDLLRIHQDVVKVDGQFSLGIKKASYDVL